MDIFEIPANQDSNATFLNNRQMVYEKTTRKLFIVTIMDVVQPVFRAKEAIIASVKHQYQILAHSVTEDSDESRNIANGSFQKSFRERKR